MTTGAILSKKAESSKAGPFSAPSPEALKLPYPYTFRIPPIGKVDPYFGLSRNAYYRCWKAGLIQTALINPPGKVGRGYRVVLAESVADYIRRQMQLVPADYRTVAAAPEAPLNPQARNRRNKPRRAKGVTA